MKENNTERGNSNVLVRRSLSDGNTSVAAISWQSDRTRSAIGSIEAQELTSAFKELTADEGIDVIVIGMDQPTFCSGWNIHDLEKLQDADSATIATFFTHGRRLLSAVADCEKPIVAVVRGSALGFGCSLLAGADIVLSCSDAVFGLPEVQRGFPPATVMPELAGIIPDRELTAWSLTGEVVSATRALHAGLVHELLVDGELDVRAAEILHSLSGASSAAAIKTKRLLSQMLPQPIEQRRLIGVDAATSYLSGVGHSRSER